MLTYMQRIFQGVIFQSLQPKLHYCSIEFQEIILD